MLNDAVIEYVRQHGSVSGALHLVSLKKPNDSQYAVLGHVVKHVHGTVDEQQHVPRNREVISKFRQLDLAPRIQTALR